MWYEQTPTVWNMGNGHVAYINPTPEMVAALEKDRNAREWVQRARERGGPITVATREAIATMLVDVKAKDIADAKFSAESLAIDGDEDAQKAVSVADYEKAEVLASSVAVVGVAEEVVEEVEQLGGKTR